MSRSLTQLIAQMQGKSLTSDWDAVVLYDQRKANDLLFQLHVERLDQNDYIKPISMVASWGEGGPYREFIHDLVLSTPRLSFENADPALPAKTTLTMDMIGGMIVSAKKNPGGTVYISKLLKILPVGGPELWMDQPVTKGVVNGLGDVMLDLSNADNFKANFVIGELGQEQVGQRFKEYFDKRIPTALKVFPLGRLENVQSDLLTPQNFQVRVIKSDPLAVMGDEQYGKGAVMLFITLKGGRDSTTFPNNQSLYLIPADGNGRTFTGTLLLSSRVVAEKILKPALESSIGRGLSLSRVGSGQDIAANLKANAGGGDFTENLVNYQYWQGGAGYGYLNGARSHLNPFPFDFTSGSGLSVTFTAGKVVIAWVGSKSGRCETHTNTISGPDIFDFTYVYHMDSKLSVSLDPQSNHVELGSPIAARSVDVSFAQNPMPVWNRDGQEITRNFITEKVRALLSSIFNSIEIPSIDTFLLRNLLFPGHNALHLTEAFMPGDLALFGQIDPLRTRSQLSPSRSTVQAGSGFQLHFTPTATAVSWTARDIEGRVLPPGVISTTGYFTAPRQDQMPEGFLNIVVTAEGYVNGARSQSSALVSVLGSTLLTHPLYDSCDRGETRQLSAEPVAGGALEWTILTPQWGSRLTTVAGEPTKRIYTAGGSSDRDTPFSLDKIEVKQISNGQVNHIHILIHNRAVTTPLWISESSEPASGTVQFELRGNNGPVDPSTVTWKLLGGPGILDERTGTYREPASVAAGSFIVVSGTIPDDLQDVHAVAAIPLPLSKYAELMDILQEDVRPIEALPEPQVPTPTGFRLLGNNVYPIQFRWNPSYKAVKYRLYRFWWPIADITGTEYTSDLRGYNSFHLRAVDAEGRLSARTDYVFFYPPDDWREGEEENDSASGKGS